ncbi:MAG: uracil-DNA glycosylase [Pseudomonadota bacterium]
MDEHRRHYLKGMGIQLWERRPAAPTVAEKGDVATKEQVAPPVPQPEKAAKPPPHFSIPAAESAPDIAELNWTELEQRVADCPLCEELVANRTQTVFGVGNNNADWMIIGEAPGADEDRLGEPFVGPAGTLLNGMLRAIGLQREKVYITNILKCRPPGNRDPKPEEIKACSPYLHRQIALVQPKIILAVGRVAAQNLLNSDLPIGKLRGMVHRHESGVPLVVTYHPAYLLRTPLEKRKAWADLCLARQIMQEKG